MSKAVKIAQPGTPDPKSMPLKTRKKNWNRVLYVQFKKELREFKDVFNGRNPATGELDPQRRLHMPFPPDVSARLDRLTALYQQLAQEAQAVIGQQEEYSRTRRKGRKDMPQGYAQPAPTQEDPFAQMRVASIEKEASWWGSRQWFKAKSLLPWGEREDARKRASLLRIAAVFEDKLQRFEDEILSPGKKSIPQGFYALNSALQFYIRLAKDFSDYLDASTSEEGMPEEVEPAPKAEPEEVEPAPKAEPDQPINLGVSEEHLNLIRQDKEIVYYLINSVFAMHEQKQELINMVNSSMLAPNKDLEQEISQDEDKIEQLARQHNTILNKAKQMAQMPQANSLTDIAVAMREQNVVALISDPDIEKIAYKTTRRMLKRLLLGLVSNLSEKDTIVIKTEIAEKARNSLDLLDKIMNLLEKESVSPKELVDEFAEMSSNLRDVAKSLILLGKDYNESAQSENIDIKQYKDRMKIISLTHLRYMMEYEREIESWISIFENLQVDDQNSAMDGEESAETVRDNLSDLVESGAF